METRTIGSRCRRADRLRLVRALSGLGHPSIPWPLHANDPLGGPVGPHRSGQPASGQPHPGVQLIRRISPSGRSRPHEVSLGGFPRAVYLTRSAGASLPVGCRLSRAAGGATAMSKQNLAVAAAVVMIAGVLTCANGLANPFVFDDYPAIVDNPQVRTLDSLGRWSRRRKVRLSQTVRSSPSRCAELRAALTIELPDVPGADTSAAHRPACALRRRRIVRRTLDPRRSASPRGGRTAWALWRSSGRFPPAGWKWSTS